MGRPRQYASATARQAAYRQRVKATTVWVDREPFARTEQAIQALHGALGRAMDQGNALARELYGATPVDTVETTVAWVLKRLQEEEGRDHMSP